MLAMIATAPTDMTTVRAERPMICTLPAIDWRPCRTSSSLSAKAGRSWCSRVGMRLASRISSWSSCSVTTSIIFGSRLA